MWERTHKNAWKKDRTTLNKTKRKKNKQRKCWSADWRGSKGWRGIGWGEDQGNGKIIIILLTST